MKPVKVSLLSITRNPETTLFKVWLQSRPQLWHDLEKYGIIDESQIDDLYYTGQYAGFVPINYAQLGFGELASDFRDYVDHTIDLILNTSLPPAEAVTLTWKMDNVSVALREQLVRHRKTSPWVQSSRNNNDSTTFECYLPESVISIPGAADVVESTCNTIRENFKTLLALGVPSEDARVIMPEGRQHGLTWTLDLREFYRVMKERSCWIAQGIWKDITEQMIDSLRENGYSFFANRLGTPPCKYSKCIYASENENRLSGHDILPVCPLYCKQKGIDYPKMNDRETEYYKRRVGALKWDPKVVNSIKK